MFGGSAKLKALEDELRITKLKLGEIEEERDDLKNLTLELQKVLSKFTTENKIRENENDEKVTFQFYFSQKKDLFCISLSHTHTHVNTSRMPRYKLKNWRRNAFEQKERRK